MARLLMNGDIPVLRYNDNYTKLEVLNNDFLPFSLRDYIKTTDSMDLDKCIDDINTLRDYLAGRVIKYNRENAKTILNVASLSQSLNQKEKLKIVEACNGLTMTDNFWIKDEGDNRLFKDVCLRNNKLSEASYIIAILGKHISATREELKPDLTTLGMFAKYWKRSESGKVELWKTDKTTENINTNAEILVSDILEGSNVNYVKYRKEHKDDKDFAVSECIASNDVSYIHMIEIADWCAHTGRDFLRLMNQYFKDDFYKMCLVDYVIFNTDRHIENWGVLVDNSTNEIISLAPLMDHNQALIADYMGIDIDELIYEPMNKTFAESVEIAAKQVKLELDESKLPDKCLKRYKRIEGINVFINEQR